MDAILNVAQAVDGVLWGPWTMVFIAFVALLLTFKSRFFQFRRPGYILRHTLGKMFDRSGDNIQGRMTPFQATSTALASTVGMGNIAGVATALSVGGPGAIFWMWLLALLGMMTKCIEITLAVHYRITDDRGRLHGGPMHYISKGLGWTFLAKLFSLGVLINSLITATLLQSHTVGRAFLSSYSLNPYLVTGGMALITATVIIGGARRIGRFCETLVPFMSLVYILCGIIIFALHYERIPEVFSSIFSHAFSPLPAAGGAAGITVAAAIKNGMAKGMLSNEAGLGTAPMAHATADTPHPFQQGMWGAFEVFIDTIVICTITSFAILSSGIFPSDLSGIELVIRAFQSVFPAPLAKGIVSFSILTFCLSTQIGFYIYYETAIIHVFGRRAVSYFRWFYLFPGIIFAGVASVDRLWVFANISVGVCSIPNLIAILALSGAAFKLMKDFVDGPRAYATSVTDRTGKLVRERKNKNG
jgi:AGCS family alanine or glycine:cation symporter